MLSFFPVRLFAVSRKRSIITRAWDLPDLDAYHLKKVFADRNPIQISSTIVVLLFFCLVFYSVVLFSALPVVPLRVYTDSFFSILWYNNLI